MAITWVEVAAQVLPSIVLFFLYQRVPIHLQLEQAVYQTQSGLLLYSELSLLQAAEMEEPGVVGLELQVGVAVAVQVTQALEALEQ